MGCDKSKNQNDYDQNFREQVRINEKKMNEIKQDYEKRITDLKNSLDKKRELEMNQIKQDYEKRITDLKNSLDKKREQEMNQIKQDYEKRITDLKNSLDKKREQEMNEIKQDYEKRITDLKNSLDKKREQEINQLKQDHEKRITDLKNSLDKKREQEINQLKQDHEKRITDLKNSLDKKREQEMNQLKQDHEKLISDLEKNGRKKDQEIDKLKQDHEKKISDLETEIKRLKENEEILRKNIEDLSKSEIEMKKFNMLPQNEEIIYDLEIVFNSLLEMKNGYNIIFNNEVAKNKYDECKKNRNVVVGVIGNFNKGKTFMLQKISNQDLPQGYSVYTKGLSIKFPEIGNNNNVVLLDSAGFETPIKNNSNSKIDDEKEISKIATDRNHTEIFLQSFILNNSHIIVCMVGVLTYSDQKLINRLKYHLKNKMIVVHNLANFHYIKEVENYIQDTLKKAFNIDQNFMNDKKKNTNDIYWSERDHYITHLVMARENSEAGNYYNPSTINHIVNQINAYDKPSEFDPLQLLKKHILDCSKEFLEEESKITNMDNIVIENDRLIVVTNKEIKQKKCLIDELGFSNFCSKNVNPDYVIYKTKDRLIIKIEIADLDENSLEIPNCVHSDGIQKIRIYGTKKADVICPDNIIILNKRNTGNFMLDLSINTNMAIITKYYYIEKVYKDGILSLEYLIVNPDEGRDENLVKRLDY